MLNTELFVCSEC